MDLRIKRKYWAYIFLLRTETEDQPPTPYYQTAAQLAEAHHIPIKDARAAVAKYRAMREGWLKDD